VNPFTGTIAVVCNWFVAASTEIRLPVDR
jgi:hypothetical protein